MIGSPPCPTSGRRAINHQKSLVRCVPYLWKSEAQLITGNLTPLFLYQHQLHFEQSQMTLGHKTSHPRWTEQRARNGWTICHTQIHFQCVPKYRWVIIYDHSLTSNMTRASLKSSQNRRQQLDGQTKRRNRQWRGRLVLHESSSCGSNSWPVTFGWIGATYLKW